MSALSWVVDNQKLVITITSRFKLSRSHIRVVF
jgi:hypothetical protein